MNHTGLGSFSLDGVMYRFETLNPLEAVRFGNRVFKVFGPALLSLAAAKKDDGEAAGEGVLAALAPALSGFDDDKVSLLIEEALRRCYTPQNEALRDEVVFNRWFMEHPDQLYGAGLL
ncbi:phage tail assembly chaperone, partial [uncultured Bilophila sp.]